VGVEQPSQLCWVRAGDVRCAVLELGGASGRAAVLLPGLTDGLAPVTEPRTRRLLADAPFPTARFRTFVVSHRDPASAPLTTRLLATDLALVLDRILDGPALVVGHSMGAMVAQHLAVDRPDQIAGMVLSATLPRADAAFRGLLARWDALIAAGRIQDFERDAFEMAGTGESLVRRRAGDGASEPARPTAVAIARHLALSSAAATHDALQRLPAVTCPTLVLAGERDRVAPVPHSRRLAAVIPHAELVVFPGTGHGFPEQDPEGFEAAVLAFADRAGL
jgi:pimeloyl-ACP methyl ester carboxylesterase